MWRSIFIIILSLLVICSVGCSNNNKTLETEDTQPSPQSTEEIALDMDTEQREGTAEQEIDLPDADRMVIHHGSLHLTVNDIDEADGDIQRLMNEYEGYIVHSTTHHEDKNIISNFTVRIPEDSFQKFLLEIEEVAVKVVEKSISGEDVTEEYVDLEARLKSKKAVETRLLDLMEKADETDDLLKISNDLSQVQEEIEVIIGRQKYLDNQVAYATVDIRLEESSVSALNEGELNTWERTKQQFVQSANFLLRAFSGLIVFFIGSLPVITPLLIVGGVVYYVMKRKKKRNKDSKT